MLVRIGRLLHRARSLPPRVLIRVASERLRGTVAARRQRAADRQSSTFVNVRFDAPLASYLGGLMLPASWAPNSDVVARYLDHRFDLLGAGWLKIQHGMLCPGVEGRHYASDAPTPDADGAWLEHEVSPANLAAARRVWSAIEPPYTPIDWHLDHKSGYRWPATAWYRDVRFAHLPGVDVKVPWELSRMQHLPQLALAFHRTGDAELWREFRNEILDWIATNPPRFGVNWSCAMDVGIRVANWLVAYDVFRVAGMTPSAEFSELLCGSVYEHGLHIVSNLEDHGGVRTNHYLADIVGLLFAAAYLPSTAETDAWLALALAELEGELLEQFHPEGSNFEGSTSYHRLSGELAVFGTALARAIPGERLEALRGEDGSRSVALPVSERMRTRIGRAGLELAQGGADEHARRIRGIAEFSAVLAKPDGAIPQFGDNDSGRLFKLQPSYARLTAEEAVRRYANLASFAELPPDAPYWDEVHLDHRCLVDGARALVQTTSYETADGAIVRALVRRELVPSAVCPPPRSMVGDERALDEFTRHLREAAPANRESRTLPIRGDDVWRGTEWMCFPDFGAYVLRSPRVYLAIRCGPVGQRGNGGHDHNDQLSFELTVDGVDWLRDPGTYLYTPRPERRNAYRSVQAHFGPSWMGEEPGGFEAGLFWLRTPAVGRCLYAGPRGFVGELRRGSARILRRITLAPGGLEVDDCATGGALARLAPWPSAVGTTPYSHVPFSPGYGIVLRQSKSGEVAE